MFCPVTSKSYNIKQLVHQSPYLFIPHLWQVSKKRLNDKTMDFITYIFTPDHETLYHILALAPTLGIKDSGKVVDSSELLIEKLEEEESLEDNPTMDRNAQIAQIRSLIHEVDKGQKTDNLYLLASRHIRAGGNTDIVSINQFLLPYGLSVTDEDLKALVAIESISFNLPLSQSDRSVLNDKLRGDGVVAYIFERNVGKVEQYVGSSINMHKRLSYYFAPSTVQNESRAIMTSFASYGINSHQLHVYPIDPSMYQDALDVRERKLSLARALEQYYIFKLDPSLNASKLAGGKVTPPIPDSKLQPLYMYNRDGTVLRAITTTRTLLGTGVI